LDCEQGTRSAQPLDRLTHGPWLTAWKRVLAGENDRQQRS